MLGFMYVFRMKYNYMNLIATPIILGIGIDDGVHALHRYCGEAGNGPKRVCDSFRLVGKAILLTSATTMLAFGSLVFSVWPGFASLGVAMFIGVGTCFLSTIVILSGIIGFLERK